MCGTTCVPETCASQKILGVRTSFTETVPLQYGMLDVFVQHAAEGRFTVPIARSFALEEWRVALDISLSGKARGKLVLLIG